MSEIQDIGALTDEARHAKIRALDDGALIGTEMVQKGAIHAVRHLLETGVTESNARQTLESLIRLGAHISAECRRRGLPVISDLNLH